jgi:membrane protein DedA with SNARE-associated domain/membrane-associated phospholipid phosphatase
MGHLADRILALHGWAVVAVVFLLPALEASAFVGVVFPGEIAVLLGGVLAFQHRAPLPAVIAAAVAGAIIGDTVGYLVGRRWGRTILHSSIGRLVRREHLDRAERYLAERGGPAVFLGRFTAALRALIPGLAGIAHLRYRTFAVYNAAGGAVWATGFVLLGYAAGTGWRQVERIAGRASLLLLLVVVVGGAIVLAARFIARHPDRIRALADRQLDRPWIRRIRDRYQRQLAFLARRLQPRGALGLSLTLGLAGILVTGWAFGALLQDVIAHDELAAVDQPVWRLFVSHREAWLTPLMRGVTNLGNAAVLIGLLVIAGLLWRWRARTWRPLGLLAGAFAGAWVLSNAVKTLTHRPRPPAAQAIGHWTGYAFPSGHVTHTAAVYGMLAALLAATSPRWGRKVGLWAAAVLLVSLIGLSRLYLGAHWLTDVLAGGALGGAWLFVLLTVDHATRQLTARASAAEQPPGQTPPLRGDQAVQGRVGGDRQEGAAQRRVESGRVPAGLEVFYFPRPTSLRTDPNNPPGNPKA